MSEAGRSVECPKGGPKGPFSGEAYVSEMSEGGRSKQLKSGYGY